MAFQYVFEEGLEMSLIAEQDAVPSTSGPKVLELDLTGFTGRLIVTQQELQQYSLRAARTVLAPGDRDDDDINNSNANDPTKKGSYDKQSSSNEPTMQQRHPQHQQDQPFTKTALPDQGASRYSKQQMSKVNATSAPASSPNPIDELAMVFCSSIVAPNDTKSRQAVSVTHSSVDSSSGSTSSYSGSHHHHSSSSGMVEVISVASSVSTRHHHSTSEAEDEHRRRDTNEDTLDQLATVFSTPASALSRNSHHNNLKDAAVDLSKIDESSRVSSSQAPSQSQNSDSSSQEDSERSVETGGVQDEDDPLGEFTTAFVALSTTPAKMGDIEGGSIDSSSQASAAPSLVPSSGSSSLSSSSSDGSNEELHRRLGDRNIHKEGSVDDYEADDPLSEFASAFGELTSAEQKRQQEMGIDEGSSAAGSSAASSHYLSAQSHSSSSLSSAGEKQRDRDSPLLPETPNDPLSDFAAAFGELSNAEKQKQTDVIDESSRSSSEALSEENNSGDRPPSHSQTSSTSQSDDPLTQFNKAYSEYSDDGEGPVSANKLNSRAHRAPEPPGEQLQQEQKKAAKNPNNNTSNNGAATKKRAASLSKKKGTKKASRPSMSAERKQKIRDLFPTYPDVSTGTHGSLDPVGVYLHQKCAAPFERTLSPRDLRELLEVFPFAAYCADDKGRLPLHTLGENRLLMQDPQGRQRATILAKILIRAYPESVKYPDSDGMLPFVALVRQWIESSYEDVISEVEREPKSGEMGAPKKNANRGQGQLGADGEYKSIAYDKLFPDTKMVPQVEWCLHMMSTVLDDMVGQGILKEAFAAKPRQEQMEARRRYVGAIMASLPYLVKAVLFLDGGVGPVRKSIAQISFIRRALLSKGSVGAWLEGMAMKKGQPSKLVIDYFYLLSNTTSEDYVGPKKTPDEEDVEAFHREKARVYRVVEKMNLEMPSLPAS